MTDDLLDELKRRSNTKRGVEVHVQGGDLLDELGIAQGQPPATAPPPATPPSEQPAGQDAGTYLRGLGQTGLKGATLSFGDELVAGLVALGNMVRPGDQSFMETYRDVRDAERFGQQQFAEQNPKTALGVELAGGLATGGVGAGRAAAARGTELAATRLGRFAQRATPAAQIGGVTGAVYGAGEAEGGVSDRLEGAVKGGAVGAVGGVALQPVVAATTAIARTPVRALRGAVRALTNSEARQADMQTARALRDLGDDPIEVARQRLVEAEGDPTLFDIGEDALLIELEELAARPGVGRNRVVNAIESRLDNQTTELADEARTIFMPQTILESGGKVTGTVPKTFKQVNEEILSTASDKAAPFYARAYKSEVNNEAPALKELLKNDRIKKAMRTAVERIKSETIDETDPNAAILRRLQDEANVDNPNLMVWDRTKRALDSMRNVAFTSGDASLAREIGGNVTLMRKVLDDQVPVYGKARKIWAGGQEEAEAHELGTKIFDRLDDLPGNTTADDLLGLVGEMSDASKQMYRTGVGQRVENILTTTPDVEGTQAISLAKRIAGSPEKRKALKTAVPDETQRRSFVQSLMREKDFSKRATGVLQNSRNKLRKYLEDEGKNKWRTIISNLIAGQFALSGNQFAQIRLATSALSGTRSALPGVSEKTAERLLELRGAQLSRALDQLDKTVRIPKSLKDVQGKSGAQLVRYFMDNPQARREFNELTAGVSAAILTNPKNRRTLQATYGQDNEQ